MKLRFDILLLAAFAVVAELATCEFVLGQTLKSEAEPNAKAVRERRRVQKLEQAKSLLLPAEPGKPDYAQGLRQLQTILDDKREDSDELGAEDVFLTEAEEENNDGSADQKLPRSLKSEARRLIGHLPADGRQAYETQFGAVARTHFEAALETKNWSAIEEVARRWMPTKAGCEATDRLGARAFDSGDASGAARRWLELWENPEVRTARDPSLSLRLAFAFRLAKEERRCVEVLDKLRQSSGDRLVTPIGKSDQLAWPEKPEDWLSWLDRWAGVSRLATPEFPAIRRHDWPIAFGDPARRGLASAAVPTEQPVWSRSLLGQGPLDRQEPSDSETANGEESSRQDDAGTSATAPRGSWGAVRFEARSRVDQARQSDQPIMPTGSAIVVNDVVLSRTLSQVRAWRLSDGEALWHSMMIDPTLTELLGKRRRGRTERNATERQEMESFVHQRLWEDRGQASLSSDGELVFSLHDRSTSLASPQMAWRGLMLPQEFNSLAATEVTTGRLRWEVGGVRGDQELAGAGQFFLGPPLPWRGKLFLLAEDGHEIRLMVLNASDGRLLWTQVLTEADPQWFGSRHDSALSPTLVGELLICPTGSGSIVAVDPIRRELVWQQTYREAFARPVPTRRFDFHASPVESFWLQSEILSVDGRLLVAAPDHNELMCLNAIDGRPLWKRAQPDGLFVAGVANSAVLVVGRTEAQAWRLEDGEPAWKSPVSLSPPSGRGVLTEGVLHQPNIRGDVVSLDAKSGQVLATAKFGSSTAGNRSTVLGNLIAANGRIISQSAESLTVLPALDELQRELAKALTENSDDPQALERRGLMWLHLGDHEKGLSDLRRSVAIRPTASAKRQLVELLMAKLTDDHSEQQSESLIRELEPLVTDPAQRLKFVRLRADHWSRQKDWKLAAQEYLKLADAWQPAESTDVEDAQHHARQDRWIGARLSNLRESMSSADQTWLDNELKTRLAAATEQDGPAELKRFVALFGWSDLGTSARRELIERLDPKKHRHSFESALMNVRRRGTVSEQAQVTARLAEHWLSLNQVERSRVLLDDLGSRFATEVCGKGLTGRELAARWQQEHREALDVSWPKGQMQVTPGKFAGTVAGKPLVVGWSVAPDAFHEFWRLEFDPSLRALVARDGSNRVQWLARQPFDEEIFPTPVGRTAQVRGRYAIVNLGSRFAVFDTIAPAGSEQPVARLLWQQVLFDRRMDQDLTPATARAPSIISGAPDRYRLIDATGRPLGRSAIINDDVVAYQTGTRLIAAEISTGETLWSYDGLPPGCELTGDDRALVATIQDSGESLVFDILDGQLLARRPNDRAAWLTTLGRNRLTWSIGMKDCELLLQDLVTGRDIRRETFAVGMLPCLSLLDTLVIWEPLGRWHLWRLSDGKNLLDPLEATVPAIANVTHIVALRDRERWLLMTHVEQPGPAGQQARVDPLHFSHWRVNGPAFAFHRMTGRLSWSTNIDWQGVNATQPADSPVLILAGTSHQPRPNATGAVRGFLSEPRAEILDRRNGKRIPLADLTQPFNHVEQRPHREDRSVEVLIDHTVIKNNSTQIDRQTKRVTFSE